MNIRKLFQINLRLEVYDDTNQIYFKSLIQETTADSIGIGIPMRRNNYLQMPDGSQWFFRLFHKKNQYIFYSTVQGKTLSDSYRVPLYLIAWPAEIKKYQRREHFRQDCTLNVHYWVLDNAVPRPGLLTRPDMIRPGRTKLESEQLALEMLAESLGEHREALTLDISGGGLLLVTDKRYKEGSRLLMRLFLRSKNKETPLLTLGHIVWAAPPSKDTPGSYRYAVEFQDVTEQLKDEIVRFIFTLTRERRT